MKKIASHFTPVRPFWNFSGEGGGGEVGGTYLYLYFWNEEDKTSHSGKRVLESKSEVEIFRLSFRLAFVKKCFEEVSLISEASGNTTASSEFFVKNIPIRNAENIKVFFKNFSKMCQKKRGRGREANFKLVAPLVWTFSVPIFDLKLWITIIVFFFFFLKILFFTPFNKAKRDEVQTIDDSYFYVYVLTLQIVVSSTLFLDRVVLFFFIFALNYWFNLMQGTFHIKLTVNLNEISKNKKMKKQNEGSKNKKDMKLKEARNQIRMVHNWRRRNWREIETSKLNKKNTKNMHLIEKY